MRCDLGMTVNLTQDVALHSPVRFFGSCSHNPIAAPHAQAASSRVSRLTCASIRSVRMQPALRNPLLAQDMIFSVAHGIIKLLCEACLRRHLLPSSNHFACLAQAQFRQCVRAPSPVAPVLSLVARTHTYQPWFPFTLGAEVRVCPQDSSGTTLGSHGHVRGRIPLYPCS